MISEENLDVRTITLGISLLDCACGDVDQFCENIYNKITNYANNLVQTGNDIQKDFGIPIVNKRISITPIAIAASSCVKTKEDYLKIGKTLDKAAKKTGENFIGGFSAIVCKGMTPADTLLMDAIPEVLANTEHICASIVVGSTKAGMNMTAIKKCGEMIKEAAYYTKDNDSLGCAKLVILCNAPDDNPFMAGAFHGVSEADAIINVGVSGPGVVKVAFDKA